MGKKRAVAAIATTPVFAVPAAAADEPEPPHHFSDDGFDPQLLRFSHLLPGAKRAATRCHVPSRFKLQKPLSKKHQHAQAQHNKQQQRRRWWSSAASAALLFFKRRPSSGSTAGASSMASSSPYNRTGPLYFADDAAGCTCWAPAMRSGHLAAAEFGATSAVISYVSLRGGAGGAGVRAPAMPIYLVT